MSGEKSTGLYNPSPFERGFNHWIDTSRLDFLLAIFPSIVAGVVFFFGIHSTPFTWITYELRHELYKTTITISAAFIGFTLTSISVLVNLLRTPLSSLDKIISQEAKRRMGFCFLDCIPAALFVCIAGVAGFIFDGAPTQNAEVGDQPNLFVQVFFIASVMFSVLRFGRIVAILKLLLLVQ